VASPTAGDADDQARISEDDRNEVETMQDTQAVSNVTLTIAKESPDHENLVSELNAFLDVIQTRRKPKIWSPKYSRLGRRLCRLLMMPMA
jgi:ribosomal protein L1